MREVVHGATFSRTTTTWVDYFSGLAFQTALLEQQVIFDSDQQVVRGIATLAAKKGYTLRVYVGECILNSSRALLNCGLSAINVEVVFQIDLGFMLKYSRVRSVRISEIPNSVSDSSDR